MDRRPRKEEPMEERRLLGIDLGIASAHTAVALRTDGSEVARRRCVPTVDSLAAVEQAALRDAPEGTRLEVVIEPSGPAWLPIAVFFGRRGHTVYRVSSAKAADLRRFLSRHAKSNGIDAKTLARLPLVDPENLYPVELPGADLAVLERYADPNALLMQGKARLVALIKRASNNHAGPERAEAWLGAAHAAVEVYAGDSAVAFADLAAEVATEVRLPPAVEAELAEHAEARESAYGRVDPE